MLRAAAAKALDLTCTIVRLADVGSVMTPATIATNVPLLVTLPTTAHQRLFNSDEFVGREMGVLRLTATQDVQVHDRIAVTGGQTWIVLLLLLSLSSQSTPIGRIMPYLLQAW